MLGIVSAWENDLWAKERVMNSPPYLIYGYALKIDLCKCTK